MQLRIIRDVSCEARMLIGIQHIRTLEQNLPSWQHATPRAKLQQLKKLCFSRYELRAAEGIHPLGTNCPVFWQFKILIIITVSV